MLKKLFAALCLILAMMIGATALAGHGVYHIDYTDEAPEKVLKSLDSRFKGYTLEDYLVLNGMNPAVGLALAEKDGHRVLAVYRMENGEMAFWYSTDSAAPQGSGEAWFEPHGEYIRHEDGTLEFIRDELGFCVVRYDLLGDIYNQTVDYSWQNGGFVLTDFDCLEETTYSALVEEGVISYYCEGELYGRVYGEIQTDMRYVSYEKLPKTLEAAKMEITIAPDDLPSGKILGAGGQRLTAKEIRFSGGRNHAVYLGPGKEYMRSGNGKGTVSTNDWIQVFGEYNGYIMIQYDISAERFRIGWIEKSALPRGASVPKLDLVMLENDDYGEVISRCVLTDDPFNSKTEIAALKPGTPVCEIVYNMGGWSYIRVTIDGKEACGFVPSDCITHG